MNNQKDTKNTSLHSYGHTDVPSVNSLANKALYDFANKKTEKLVTALYMVTDCMDTDDALKSKLRLLGVELLSDMFKLPSLSPIDKATHISNSQSRISELLSFIDIASTIGFISEMNSSILNREFKNLITELQSYQSKDTHFAFTLEDAMFEVEKKEESFPTIPSRNDSHGYKGQIIKRTYLPFSTTHKAQSLAPSVKSQTRILDKQDRSQKIVSVIKASPDSKIGVSIKDIAIAFTDCGEKTIQRELNALVDKGLIKKIGEKRWSRYQSI